MVKSELTEFPLRGDHFAGGGAGNIRHTRAHVLSMEALEQLSGDVEKRCTPHRLRGVADCHQANLHPKSLRPEGQEQMGLRCLFMTLSCICTY